MPSLLDKCGTGQLGGRVFLSCSIYNLHNKSVSWIRERDGYILTVDTETFISDPRYSRDGYIHQGSKIQ